MQSNGFLANQTLNTNGKLIDLSIPRVMGILNVTPDSFFDGGRYVNEYSMLQQIEKMLEEGADFIDVGGYSSRPGAEDITPQEELERVIPAVRIILKAFPEALLSVDTFRSQVAQQAVDQGAVMINDISGGELDKGMFDLVARYRVPYVLMHMKGTPQTMSTMTQYNNILEEMIHYFQIRIRDLRQRGVKDILIDPGLGFAKTAAQNFEILKHLDILHMLDAPLMVGLSRKSFIWKTLNTNPENALHGSTALHIIALLRGSCMLRVHDIKPAVEAIKLTTFVT